MTKQKLNIARLILIAVLVVSLTAAVGMVAFAEDADITAQTRVYNATFDRMLDDGSGDGASPAYRSINWEAGQCDDAEEPILKLASSVLAGKFDALNITLRSSDVKLSDLTIAFRIADGVPLKVFTLDSEDITDGIGTDFEIGEEWQTLSIDMASTNTGIDTNTPNSMVGIHLYATDNTKAGSLDIRNVSVTSDANETVIMNFADVADVYWSGTEGGTFVDYPKAYAITDSKQIVSEEGNLDEAYAAIVLQIKGEGTVSVAPITQDGVGTAKAWTELKDLEGVTVSAIGEAYANHVISLESLGAKAVKGVQITVTGGSVEVAQAFLTNMESRDADKYFPVLDADSVAYMTQFDFEYLNADDNYDASVEKCAEYNLWYVLCYNGNPSPITDGHLALNANGQAFTGMKIRSKVASEGRRFLVIKYKLQNGATLNEFRFDVIQNTDAGSGVKVVYANDLKAGFGLPSLSELNPYKASGGYSYLVVDLLETYGVTDIAGLDIYFSGEGQLLIDEIFYAHPQVAKTVVSENNILTEDLEIAVNDAGEADPAYQYVTGIDLDGKRHDGIQFVMRGENADVTLDDIRIELGGKTLYFNNNASLALDIYGREMPALTEANQVYAIDFAQSGVEGLLNNMHIHATTVAGGKKIIVEAINYIDYDLGDVKVSDEILAEPVVVTSENEGYKYIVGFNVPNIDDKKFAVMEIEIEGDISELRIEMGGGTYWVKENDLSLRDLNGQLFDTTITTKRTLAIDLKQTGIMGDITTVDIHNTFAAGATVTVSSVKFKGYTDMVVSDELITEDIEKEAAEGYYYAGWIPAEGAYIPQKLVLKVNGDLTNVRLGFEGLDKTLWFAENPEGVLYGTDGNMFNLTETGERTIVIDLAKSGLYYPLKGIHVHNADNALTISSAVYYSMPLGNENVVFAVNDDSKPVISQNIAATGKVGTEINLSATAVDNYDENVVITYEVTLGSIAVTVTDGKFTPTEAGTYAVKITATDAAGNVATETVSITVSGDQTTEPNPTDPETKDGLSTGAIVGIVLACVAVVCGGVVAFIFIRKKKLGK